MANQQLEVLEQLAELAPTQFLERTPGGQSTLRELYSQAAEADLVPSSAAADDIARLHGLWEVALDHGMGGLVLDYLSQVCFDRLRTSSDPLESFLMDGECVRRWVQKLLAVSRGRLASWLARGLSSAGGAGILAKELGRLQMLHLVAEGLQPHADGGSTQPAATTTAAAAAAAAAAEAGELAEASRLLLCARVLAWLSQQRLAFERTTGRFFSEQEWRSVAAKRREGAAAAAGGGGGLFLSDLLSELARHGPDSPAYPPSSADRLLSALFLAPGGSGSGGAAAAGGGTFSGTFSGTPGEAALHARLALLAYYLADGGFMQAEAVVEGLRAHFGVPPATAAGWLLQQLLDESGGGGAAGAAALQRAAQLVPGADGAGLPHRVLQVLVGRGRPDLAVLLLRQRPESAGGPGEAAAALAVRFQAGLLTEAILGVKRALAAADGGGDGGADAAPLLGQLLQYAAATRGPDGMTLVHAVARMPWRAAEEEAVVGWLEGQAAGGQLEAALMLPLYFLLRGRTPEALHAYARQCPATPTTQQQADLAELLAEAARMLPAPQRALVVRRGAAPALLPADGGEEGGGVALMAAIPAVAADVAPAMLAVGPSPAQAPLVGSVPVLLERRRMAALAAARAAAADGGRDAHEPGAATAPRGGAAQQQPPALLFGQQQPAAAAAADASPAPSAVFGATGKEALASSAVFGGGAAVAHEFDRVLGLGSGRPAAAGARGGKRRWAGGSAYR